MRPFLFLLPCVPLLLSPATASAQGISPAPIPPLAAGKEATAPGTWVRYSMLFRKTGQVVKVHLACLEKEGDAQWFEMGITDHQRRTLTFKALLKGDLTREREVLKVIVQPPGQRPLLLPASLAKDPLPRFSAGPAAKAVPHAGGKLRVAAGTFEARRYRTEIKGSGGSPDAVHEAWFSPEIPAWPMIKVSTPELVMELAGHGTGAQTKVKGKPVKMDEDLARKLGIGVP